MANVRKDANSLTGILAEFMKIHNDALGMLKALTEASTTEKDRVTFLSYNNGTQVNYTLPSYSYLLKKINELNSNYQKLDNSKNKTLNQPIFGIESISEPPKIENLNSPSIVYNKPNWFLENLLNPLLYVKLDVTKYIHPQSKYVEVKRLVPVLDDPNKVSYFKNTINGKNDLVYETVVADLVKNGIAYREIDEMQLLKPLVLNKSGNFSVTNITNSTTQYTGYSTVKIYTFTSIEYKDVSSGSEVTRVLQVNDKLVTTDGETEYNVLYVDQNKNEITLGLLAGYQVVQIGTNVLKIASDLSGAKEVEIPVGYEEATILFLKSVDPYFHTTTQRWGAGLAFSSGDLYTIDSTGKQVSLSEFYSNVKDLGVILSGMVDDQSIPASLGVMPEKPVLDSRAFKVVKINSHISNSEQSNKLTDLIAQKEFIDSEIRRLNEEISRILSPAQQQPLINQKNVLIANHLNPINKEILAMKGQLTSSTTINPKYHIRGFVDLPEAPTNIKTGKQEIIQLLYSYRYLDLNNNPPTVTRHTYTTTSGDIVNAMFSEWVEIYGPLRKKIWNETSQEYEWNIIDNSNPNEVDINQISIPISMGERIELKVKLITEAGYPVNPIMSDWSNPIVINFDENLYIKDQQYEAALDNLKYYALQIEMNQCCIDNTLAINTMMQRLNSYEKALRDSGIKLDELYTDKYPVPPDPTVGEVITICETALTGVTGTIPPTSGTCNSIFDFQVVPDGPADLLFKNGYHPIIIPTISNVFQIQDPNNPSTPVIAPILPGVTGGTNELPTGYVAIGCETGCDGEQNVWVVVPISDVYGDAYSKAIEMLQAWGCTSIYGYGAEITPL